jgi:penicillin G amidase
MSVFGAIGRTMLKKQFLSVPVQIELPHNIVIHHDAMGIPTVTAPAVLDIYFGQGYLAALHRLWQMETNRRVATATLAEVVGETALEIDQWVCRVGLPEAVEASYAEISSDAALMAILEKYSAGVNYALEHLPWPYGLEFGMLNYHPDPWQPRDCVCMVEMMSWGLSGNWEEQLVRGQMLAVLGAEQASLLESDTWELPDTDPQSAALVAGISTAYAELLQVYQHIREHAGILPRRAGSNAWVVAGQHTDSGKPILAADPHLPLGLPGYFYEVRLRSQQVVVETQKPLLVAGAALPGVPGVVIGRNEQFGWSITVCGAITAELRIEARDAPTHNVAHILHIKGKPDVEEVVRWSERGPIVDHLSSHHEQEDSMLALQWIGHRGDVAGTLRAIGGINLAQTVEQLRVACMKWSAPVVNFVWAEVEQNHGAYGWRVAGYIPLRRKHSAGLLPTLAVDGDVPWTEGYIPADELPEEISPDRGYIFSANQRMADASYPYILSHEYMAPDRARRIEQLLQKHLSSDQPYTVEQARKMQIDQVSLPAMQLCHLVTLYVSPQSELEQAALALLQKWNGTLGANSAGGAIIKVLESHLLILVAQMLFDQQQELGDQWRGIGHTPLAIGTMGHWRLQEVLFGLIQKRPEGLKALPTEIWPTLLQRAFEMAVIDLKQLSGSNPEYWRWGKLHKLELDNPLVQHPVYKPLPGGLRLLKRLLHLSRGPFEIGGDEHTIWQTSSFPMPYQARTHPHRFYATAYQPSWRMIVSDQYTLYGCLPGGVSGQVNSPWLDNQLDDYLKGRLHKMTLS